MILKGILVDKEKKGKAGDAEAKKSVEYIKNVLPVEDRKGF